MAECFRWHRSFFPDCGQLLRNLRVAGQPVSITLREGSVFNPRLPAPVGASTVCTYRLTDIVLEALGHFNPPSAVAN